jgi:hypothetical protein
MPIFSCYIGIDYSGAKTPSSSLRGLRIYSAEGDGEPREVPPPPSSRKYWSRRGAAEWLINQFRLDRPTLVGIDHGFSFPLAYFQSHGLALSWDGFLDDFCRHWPTDDECMTIDLLRKVQGGGSAGQRQGDRRWRRLTERRCGGAKSVFHFDVEGQVAKSTHAGIPWLRRIRQELGSKVHFWPFDGWDIPHRHSALAEVYPRLWSSMFQPEPGRTADQHDAFCVAAWLSRADRAGRLAEHLKPRLEEQERFAARVEGWILGA